VVTRAYVPKPGDVVWLQFDPQAGHEQGGHRPALVLSPERYNDLRGMMSISSAEISRLCNQARVAGAINGAR